MLRDEVRDGDGVCLMCRMAPNTLKKTGDRLKKVGAL